MHAADPVIKELNDHLDKMERKEKEQEDRQQEYWNTTLSYIRNAFLESPISPFSIDHPQEDTQEWLATTLCDHIDRDQALTIFDLLFHGSAQQTREQRGELLLETMHDVLLPVLLRKIESAIAIDEETALDALKDQDIVQRGWRWS